MQASQGGATASTAAPAAAVAHVQPPPELRPQVHRPPAPILEQNTTVLTKEQTEAIHHSMASPSDSESDEDEEEEEEEEVDEDTKKTTREKKGPGIKCLSKDQILTEAGGPKQTVRKFKAPTAHEKQTAKAEEKQHMSKNQQKKQRKKDAADAKKSKSTE